MKYSTICAAFLAAAVTASDVKQLNKDTFKAFVEENDLVLAECKSPVTAIPGTALPHHCHY
jgi:protein disulfide-isomerase A1